MHACMHVGLYDIVDYVQRILLHCNNQTGAKEISLLMWAKNVCTQRKKKNHLECFLRAERKNIVVMRSSKSDFLLLPVRIRALSSKVRGIIDTNLWFFCQQQLAEYT